MMKSIKLSWGTGIFFLYTGFVAMVIFFVSRSMDQKIDLVAPDYYKQELQYQEKIDQRNRAAALEIPLTWELTDESVKIKFPPMDGLKGNVLFFRPSDNLSDVSFPVAPGNDNVQVVSYSSLKPGVYKMQISWEAKGVEYFNEAVVYIK